MRTPKNRSKDPRTALWIMIGRCFSEFESTYVMSNRCGKLKSTCTMGKKCIKGYNRILSYATIQACNILTSLQFIKNSFCPSLVSIDQRGSVTVWENRSGSTGFMMWISSFVNQLKSQLWIKNLPVWLNIATSFQEHPQSWDQSLDHKRHHRHHQPGSSTLYHLTHL